MLIVIGYIVVAVATLGSYWAMGGYFGALWQPFEFTLIAGSAMGAFIAASNKGSFAQLRVSVPKALKRGKYTKELYYELMSCLEALLSKYKREGPKKIEGDIEAPMESEIFKRFPMVLNNKNLLVFICDYMRLIISGNMQPHEIQDLMEDEIETFRMEADVPVKAMTAVADGLPAFGIVAAVLGVIKALAAVDQPPAILADLISKAMVGTFLGIFLAYGFAAPLASSMERSADDEIKAFECIKATIIAVISNYPVPVAVEFGRKMLFSTVRPSFEELEEKIREMKAVNRKA